MEECAWRMFAGWMAGGMVGDKKRILFFIFWIWCLLCGMFFEIYMGRKMGWNLGLGLGRNECADVDGGLFV